ncbi:hypothetical protein F4859DRAFT_520625 [Xylaria cf. heliscus]|nr:hypothetical protein F4859DRAFT_520625 [Xylaria cf. heliscus]
MPAHARELANSLPLAVVPETPNVNYASHSPSIAGSAPGRARQLSDTGWGDLKDLLHRLYIQENRTLEKIRTILREQHGLVLTQKQLTKRFSEWRFKKNVKQTEIKDFLSKADHASGRTEPSVEGVRITAAKRERWDKRARLEQALEDTRTTSARQKSSEGSHFDEITPVDHNEETISMALSCTRTDSTSTHSSTTAPPDNASPMASSSTLSPSNLIRDHSPSSPSLNADDISTLGRFHVRRNSTPGQSLPDDPWSTLSLLDNGFSLMHRLFSALKIEPPDDMMPLVPPVTSTDVTTQRPLTITNEQLMELSHGGLDVPWSGAQCSVYESPPKKRLKASAFKCLGIDAIFPSQEVIFANPLDIELYPFPHHYQSRHDYTPPPKTHDILRKEMQESSEKLQRLESVALGKTDAAVALIDSLAVAYFGLGHYNEAEKQFKRMLPRLLQCHPHNSRYVISVKRDLAEVILHLGRFEEANKMARDVYDLALAIDTPGGRLTQRSLHVLAQSYGNLRDLPKEEVLLRQLVQIRLSSLGPRHGDTLAAIRSLCDSIIDSERLSESEELLRVALELSQSAEVSDRRKCLISRKLATVLYKKGNYRDSEALYRKTLDMSVQLLGDEHPDTLRCRFWLCKTLRARGLLRDSYELHSKTIQQQIKTRGELRGSTIESMAGLSTLLAQMGNMTAAEVWMRRALRCSEQIGGVDSARATKFWGDLKSLDEEPLKQQDISNLYEDMSHEIALLVGPGSRSIEEMTRWHERDRQ